MPIKIFIDQGHNPSGFNAGAEANGLREQDITYLVGIYLRDLLNNNPEFAAITSRNTPSESLGTDKRSSLQERIDMAKKWGAHYFISIHVNGSLNSALNGTEAFVYRKYSPVYWLADDIVNAISSRMQIKKIGTYADPSLYVIAKSKMPAVLLELGFVSNPQDAKKMEEDPYGFSYAIYQGILKYFGL